MTRLLAENLQKLKDNKHVPTKFEPLATESKELTVCASALEKYENSPYQRGQLSNFAYITFLLGETFSVPNQAVDINCMPALQQYKKIAINKGYCDKAGYYFTAKISPDDFILRAMTNPNLKGFPNFFRAWFLMQLAYTKVLPKILKNMEKNTSISEFETDIMEFYTFIAEIFIPNLCQFFHFRMAGHDISIMLLISKLLSEFPAALFPQTIAFIEAFNQHALANLSVLSQAELFEMLKLNEHAEVCHQHRLLLSDNKQLLIIELIKRIPKLTHDEILKILQMKYTLFYEQQENLQVFDDKFSACLLKQEQQFRMASPQPHELNLVAIIENRIESKYKASLTHSYVCRQTGREIDIAFNHMASKKIAIHIDGPFAHYYLDREQENRKTQVRNKALENAGWVNICQPVARAEKDFMVVESRQLLQKLALVLPFKKTLTSIFFPENKLATTVLAYLSDKDRKSLACVNHELNAHLK